MDLLTRTEYADWWNDNTDDDGELLPLDDPATATLAAHVQELQLRIDRLMDPDEHDAQHNADARPGGCRCYLTRCACAYDHPDAVCMVHDRAAEPS
jgi:hypothetical protein